jgi:hypothetical protein
MHYDYYLRLKRNKEIILSHCFIILQLKCKSKHTYYYMKYLNLMWCFGIFRGEFLNTFGQMEVKKVQMLNGAIRRQLDVRDSLTFIQMYVYSVC